MSLISGLNHINFANWGKSYPVGAESRVVAYQPSAKEAVAPVEYNLNRPRHNDSDGVSGESNLAKRLDYIS